MQRITLASRPCGTCPDYAVTCHFCVGSQPILTDIEWGRMKVQLPSNYATLLRLK